LELRRLARCVQMSRLIRLLVICARAALVSLTACDNGGGSLDRPLHFELPLNYSGPVLLIAQPDAPKALSTKPKEYRIVIPPSGVLRLSDSWVLQRWHSTRASFSDGTPIPTQPASRARFHEGSTSTTKDKGIYYNWFFVGEKSAAEDFFWGRDSDRLEREWLDQHGVK
jgi:hypothetical protein